MVKMLVAFIVTTACVAYMYFTFKALDKKGKKELAHNLLLGISFALTAIIGLTLAVLLF